MSLLEIEGLTHSFGENILYENAALTLNRGEHAGVVGKNGAGKSTLIKICTGRLPADSGHVVWAPGIKTGCLDQYAEIEKTMTVMGFLRSAFADLEKVERQMLKYYERAAQGDEKYLEKAAECQQELEIRDYYSADTKIEQVMEGLGLSSLGGEHFISEMSGGQRAKIILAKILLEEPDVLLLDEPTNFLDHEHVAWLAGYLSQIENAFLVVSHDDEFLNLVSNRIFDVDQKTITKYYGTYTEFQEKKAARQKTYERRYNAQQKKIRATEEFIRKNIAGRKSRMAKGRRKQLERMMKIGTPDQREEKPFFKFREIPSNHTEYLTVKQLSVGYDVPILRGIEFNLMSGQKAVITGFNGIGKSTLIKTLTGQIKSIDGQFRLSDQAETAYFEQDFSWEDKTKTPVEIISEYNPDLTAGEVRRYLARCGIGKKHALQEIHTLSGDEQAKVKLCLLTLKPCNFLILDEPTNHLDVTAKEALREAIMKFQGTVLLVSHGESFYKDWVQKIIHIGK